MYIRIVKKKIQKEIISINLIQNNFDCERIGTQEQTIIYEKEILIKNMLPCTNI